jgi:N-hydroxyarylamine O-acetyltransferase
MARVSMGESNMNLKTAPDPFSSVSAMANERDPDGFQLKIDLDAYFARIGYKGELAPTVEALRDLHFAHSTSIPFENLDILLGRAISLELDLLQAKLVAGGRGGYCFEHNTLRCRARVAGVQCDAPGGPGPLPRI